MSHQRYKTRAYVHFTPSNAKRVTMLTMVLTGLIVAQIVLEVFVYH